MNPFRTLACAGDPAALRAYLSTPPRGVSGSTVAQRLGLDASFRTGAPWVATRLSDLVTWAEGDGVFGLDDHEVHIYQVVGGPPATMGGYLLTVQPAQGPQLCLGTLTEQHLLGRDTHGVDAAVHALTVLAAHVTAVVGDQDTHLRLAARSATHRPDHASKPPVGHPFPGPGPIGGLAALGGPPPPPVGAPPRNPPSR